MALAESWYGRRDPGERRWTVSGEVDRGGEIDDVGVRTSRTGIRGHSRGERAGVMT